MRLPLFPLHVVLFPHLPLPLHIFEERYRAMTRDLLSPRSHFDGRFVVAMITEGREVNDRPASSAVGTICEVRSVSQLPDGGFDIVAVGVERVVIGTPDLTGAYAVADVTRLPEVEGADAAPLVARAQAALDGYLETVKQYVATAASVGKDSQEIQDVAASINEVLHPIRLPPDPLAASYAIGGVLQIELSRKQQLLELPDAATRLRAEIALLRREAHLLSEGALPPVASGEIHYNPN